MTPKMSQECPQNVAQNAYEEFISKYILEKMGQSYDTLYLNLIDLKYD